MNVLFGYFLIVPLGADAVALLAMHLFNIPYMLPAAWSETRICKYVYIQVEPSRAPMTSH